jgi:hypothetical protein
MDAKAGLKMLKRAEVGPKTVGFAWLCSALLLLGLLWLLIR